jgi:hypothetical protein
MTLFLWVNFVLLCSGLCINAHSLATKEFPQVRTKEAVATGMVINVGFLVWVAVLLFN